jgi:hypothetical protein
MNRNKNGRDKKPVYKIAAPEAETGKKVRDNERGGYDEDQYDNAVEKGIKCVFSHASYLNCQSEIGNVNSFWKRDNAECEFFCCFKRGVDHPKKWKNAEKGEKHNGRIDYRRSDQSACSGELIHIVFLPAVFWMTG